MGVSSVFSRVPVFEVLAAYTTCSGGFERNSVDRYCSWRLLEKSPLLAIAEKTGQYPKHIILQKLIWYRLGGGVSDRQWRDVLGVLKVQADRLDFGRDSAAGGAGAHL